MIIRTTLYKLIYLSQLVNETIAFKTRKGELIKGRVDYKECLFSFCLLRSVTCSRLHRGKSIEA